MEGGVTAAENNIYQITSNTASCFDFNVMYTVKYVRSSSQIRNGSDWQHRHQIKQTNADSLAGLHDDVKLNAHMPDFKAGSC